MTKRVLIAVLALSSAGPAVFAAQEEERSSGFALGFDALLRGERAANFELGALTLVPGRAESQLLARLRPSLSFDDRSLGARVEGQFYGARGAEPFSETSVYQGYAEARVPGKVALRAGRQELAYGSAFLLGADSFYDGQSYDALKLTLQPAMGLSVDAFLGKYVRKNSGGIEGELFGVYGTYTPREELAVDLYALGDTGGAGLTHRGGRHERTYSVGARFAARVGDVATLEIEPVYQFGRKRKEGSSHDEIRAFGGHADLTVGSAKCALKGLLGYAYGSGDRRAADGTFREFHNPSNDTPLVGDVGVVGDLSGVSVGDARASGLQVYTAGATWQAAEALEVSLDAHRFLANRVPDGFSRDVGTEANLVLTYRFRDNLAALLSVNRFFTGRFFEEASGSGRDIGYGYLQLQATL